MNHIHGIEKRAMGVTCNIPSVIRFRGSVGQLRTTNNIANRFLRYSISNLFCLFFKWRFRMKGAVSVNVPFPLKGGSCWVMPDLVERGAV